MSFRVRWQLQKELLSLIVQLKLVQKKSGGRLLKKDASASGKGAADSLTSEPQKSAKKHILIKKKKTEEELAEEAKEFPSIRDESLEDSSQAASPTALTVDPLSVGEPAGRASLSEAPEETTEEGCS